MEILSEKYFNVKGKDYKKLQVILRPLVIYFMGAGDNLLSRLIAAKPEAGVYYKNRCLTSATQLLSV